jgi:hypothetical protein
MRRSTSRYTILSSVLVLFVLLKLDNLTEHHLQHHSSGNIDEVNQETFIENHTPPPSAETPSRLIRRRNLQVFSRLGSYLDPKSIALREHHPISPPPPPPQQQQQQQQQQQHETKVSYITSFWAKPPNEEQVNPHRREVEAALVTNIHNPHFDQIVVFLDTQENAISESSCSNFYQDMADLSREVFHMSVEEANGVLTAKVTCVNVMTGQPTYYQMFTNALSEEVIGGVVVLANADMAFDDTVSLARTLHPEVLVVLGTSGFTNNIPTPIKNIYEQVVGTDYMTNYSVEQLKEWGINRCTDRESKWSWDTWIFHKDRLVGKLNEENFKRRIQNNDLVPFNMNENGAENASLWAIQQAYPFSSIYNACDRIHSWHFHLTPKTHKVREVPWWNVDPESVPRPWGGYTYPEGNRKGFPPKDPECVRTDSCFGHYHPLSYEERQQLYREQRMAGMLRLGQTGYYQQHN